MIVNFYTLGCNLNPPPPVIRVMYSCFSILQDSMATTYEDEGPIPWFRTEQCIFYIVFFVVFPFFFVNIFVALIIVTFNELGEAELEDDMDKNQKSCIDFAIRARFFTNLQLLLAPSGALVVIMV